MCPEASVFKLNIKKNKCLCQDNSIKKQVILINIYSNTYSWRNFKLKMADPDYSVTKRVIRKAKQKVKQAIQRFQPENLTVTT